MFRSKRMIMKAIVIAVALASCCCASASSSPLASLRESRERIERFFAGRGRGADPSQLLDRRIVSGTRCLDGSPAGFYYALGEPGTDTLVINLEGGGACSSAEECRGRARTRYGSSRYWSEAFPADQILLSSDPEENPDFWSAHHVYVPYCTGDLHAGTRTEAGDETFGYYFSGARNFEAIVERFKSIVRLDARFSQPSRVLLNGQSAGAVGVNRNVDKLAALYPDADVRAVPNSGWYYPERFNDPRYPGDLMETYTSFANGGTKSLFDEAEGTTNVDVWAMDFGECAEDFVENPRVCFSETINYKYTKSPVFVLGYLFDSQELVQQQGLPLTREEDANSTTFAYLRAHGESVFNSISSNMKEGDGYFLSACFEHVVSKDRRVDGQSWIPLVGDWFYGRPGASNIRVVDSCFEESGLPCGACGRI